MKIKILNAISMLFIVTISYSKDQINERLLFAHKDINTIDKSSKNKDSSRYIIRGKVYDSAFRQEIPFVLTSISIKNRHRRGCISNVKGEFELKLPQKFLKKNFTLKVASGGYTSVEVKIENKKSVLDTTLIFYLPPARYSDEIINTR